MSRLQSAATSAGQHRRVPPVAPASVSHATGDGECCERRSCAVLTALPPVIKCRMTVLLRAVGYASFCIRTANGSLDRCGGIVRISRGNAAPSSRRCLRVQFPRTRNSRLRLRNAQRTGVVSGGLNNSQTSSSQPAGLEPDIFLRCPRRAGFRRQNNPDWTATEGSQSLLCKPAPEPAQGAWDIVLRVSTS